MVECGPLPALAEARRREGGKLPIPPHFARLLAPSTLRRPPRHLNDRAVWPICVGCPRPGGSRSGAGSRTGASARQPIAATMRRDSTVGATIEDRRQHARQPKQLRTKALRTRPARQPPPHPRRGTNPRPFARAKPMSGPGEFPLPTARRRCRRPRVTFGRPRRMPRRPMAPARCRRARRASRTHRLRRHRLAMKTWRAGDRGHAGGLSGGGSGIAGICRRGGLLGIWAGRVVTAGPARGRSRGCGGSTDRCGACARPRESCRVRVAEAGRRAAASA